MRPWGTWCKEQASRLLPLVFCLIGLSFFWHPLLKTASTQTFSNALDGKVYHYFLEHSYRWASGKSALWDGPIFFPAKNTFAYDDTLLGVAPLYWALRSLGLRMDFAHDVWFLLLMTCNFGSFYLLCRHCFNISRFGSSLAAFLFAFTPLRFGQVYYSAQFYTVLSLYGLLRALGERKDAWLVLFFAGFVGQLYSSFYLVWFYFFALSISFAVAFAIPAYREVLFLHVSRAKRWLSLLLAVSTCLVLPRVISCLKAVSQVGFRSWEVSTGSLADWWAWSDSRGFFYSWQAKVWPWNSPRGGDYYEELCIGFVATLLGLWGLYRSRSSPHRRTLFFLCVTAFIVALLTTRFPFELNLWFLVYSLFPGAQALRGMGRSFFLVIIPLTIGVGLLWDQRKRTGLLLLLVCIAMAEQYRPGQPINRDDVFGPSLELADEVRKRNCQAFFYMPILDGVPPRDAARDIPHVDAMLASLETGVPTVNGYSANYPRDWAMRFFPERPDSPPLRVVIQSYFNYWVSQNKLDPTNICWIEKDPRLTFLFSP